MKKYLNENNIAILMVITVVLSIIGIIFTLSVYLFNGHIILFSDFDDTKILALGSLIGGLFGTLITISATFLIWLTYNSQKRELEKTTQIAEVQSKTLITQQFENTFFNMVKILAEIPQNVNGLLKDGGHKSEYEGFNFLEKALHDLIRKFDPEWNWDTIPDKELMENTTRIYNKYADEYLSPLDHYFRYVYNILKFIDNSQIENKKMYADLLQAQLPKTQLGLLFYNGIGRTGKTKLYGLFEKYNFLENLNPDSIFLKNNSHTKLYPFTTFKFLNLIQKGEIVLNSIIMNPDRIEQFSTKKYYIQKYNLTNDIVRELYKYYENNELKIWRRGIDKRIIENILEEMLNKT